jgi:NAD dependent epimerase/dehydratase
MGRVLVTGADGFIGSHLVEELVRLGREVRAFVYYNSFDSRGWLDTAPEQVKKAIEVFPGDIRDGAAVRRALTGCEGVLHLAALIGIPYSYVAPESYITTNVVGTLNVVEAARDLGLKKVVVTSTSEVYGTAQFVPITEEHPVVGQSPYSATKIGADQVALSYYRSFDTPVAVVRPFNTYGPRQSARAVIPTVITQIVDGRRRIKLGALHPTRDLSYVRDTALGMIAIYDSPASPGEVINLGSNFEVSIGDLVKTITKIMGVEIEIETEAQRMRPGKSEVERLFADTSKAARLLKWSPEYGGIEGLSKGLKLTIDWFSDPANRARYKVGQYTV